MFTLKPAKSEVATRIFNKIPAKNDTALLETIFSETKKESENEKKDLSESLYNVFYRTEQLIAEAENRDITRLENKIKLLQEPLPTPFGAKPHRMVSKFSTRTPAATSTATTHPSPVSRGTRKMAATLTSAFPTSDSAPTHPITKLQASPPTMRCRPTLKSACPTTSWWAPAIRGAILLMNRATSASSSPEATPITCATPTLRPTSTAPMSSARTLASLFPTPPRLTLWPPSSSTTGTSTAPQSRRAASPIRSMVLRRRRQHPLR